MILGMSRRGERTAKHGTGRGRKNRTNSQRNNRRELGQNFLRETWAARRIVAESGVGKDDLVVELGAGGGMLTRQLALVSGRVVAVEYDPFWALHLSERFSEHENVQIVRGDALSVKLPGEPFKVVANIPFHATTSILHRLLDDPGVPLQRAHLLVQKQVARKHARSSPSTLKTLHWSPWYAFCAGLVLPADAFHPKPEVDACLMVASKRGPPLVHPSHRFHFRALVRQAFTGRGNCVGMALRPIFTRTQLRRLARDNAFVLDVPPSCLTVHQWASVFDFMIRTVPRDLWPTIRCHVRREKQRR